MVSSLDSKGSKVESHVKTPGKTSETIPTKTLCKRWSVAKVRIQSGEKPLKNPHNLVNNCADLVELEKCCKTQIHLQKSASIQPRTSPPKIGNIWNFLPTNCKMTQKRQKDKIVYSSEKSVKIQTKMLATQLHICSVTDPPLSFPNTARGTSILDGRAWKSRSSLCDAAACRHRARSLWS